MNRIIAIFFVLLGRHVFSQIQVGVIDGHTFDERYAVINGGMPEAVCRDIITGVDSLRRLPYERRGQIKSNIYPAPIELADDAKWCTKAWRTIPINDLNLSLIKGDRRIHITRNGSEYIIDTLYGNYSIGLMLLLKEKILKDPSWFTCYNSVDFFQDSILPNDVIAELVTKRWDSLNKLQLKEYWYYDKTDGNIKNRIIGISFLYEETGTTKNLFTMYYPELFWYIHNLTIDGYFDEYHMWNDVFENHLLVSEIDSIESTSVFQFSHMGNGLETELPNQYHLEAYLYQTYFKQLTRYYVDTIPFNGSVNFETLSGKVINGSFHNGLMGGEWSLKASDGQMIAKLNYGQGKANGSFVLYHENGIVKNQGNFAHGLKVGKWTGYANNGDKTSELVFNNGWLDGEQRAWYQNGQLYMKYYYNEFVIDGPFERYWTNGDLMEKGNMKRGYREGEWEFHLNLPAWLEKVLRKSWSNNLKPAGNDYLNDLISDSKVHMRVDHIVKYKEGAYENMGVQWVKMGK